MPLLENIWKAEHDSGEIIDQEVASFKNTVKSPQEFHDTFISHDDLFIPNPRIRLSRGKWLAREQDRLKVRREFYKLLFNEPKYDVDFVQFAESIQRPLAGFWQRTWKLAREKKGTEIIERVKYQISQEIARYF